jgi:hypothetical protein
MMPRLAVPFIILAAIFLPLPFALSSVAFSALLAVRPRGEPALEGVRRFRLAGPAALRSPPR